MLDAENISTQGLRKRNVCVFNVFNTTCLFFYFIEINPANCSAKYIRSALCINETLFFRISVVTYEYDSYVE